MDIPNKLSLNEILVNTITVTPGLSAFQLATVLNEDASSVSSLLKKMSDDGRVYRASHQGPRGGFGYFISPPSGPRTLVTIERARELTKVSRRTIYHWIRDGKIEVLRTAGGSLRIYADTLFRPSDAETPKRLFTPPKPRKSLR